MFRQFRILIISGLSLAMSACLDLAESINTLIKEDANTAQTKKAILFLKEGGATESDSYQVSIVNFEGKPDKAAVGNAFIVDDDHGKAWLNPKCVELKWLANDTLAISYNSKLRTFLQNRTVSGVTVVYRQK